MGVIGYSVTGRTALKQGTSATGIPLDSAPEPTAETDSNPVADNWVKFYDTPRIWGYRDETGETWIEAATIENVKAEMKEVNAWTELVGRWRAVIGQSEQLVDITSLSPPYGSFHMRWTSSRPFPPRAIPLPP